MGELTPGRYNTAFTVYRIWSALSSLFDEFKTQQHQGMKEQAKPAAADFIRFLPLSVSHNNMKKLHYKTTMEMKIACPKGFKGATGKPPCSCNMLFILLIKKVPVFFFLYSNPLQLLLWSSTYRFRVRNLYFFLI
jgi:hypothetical protein